MTVLAAIVVPALDEERAIAATLAPLQPLRREGHEIIVVDGGSRDATRAIAAPLADRVVVAARGRASQMNAGAALACGDVLLFLHADSRLEERDVRAMLARVATSRRRWGRFDVAIEGRSPLLPWVASAMNLRSRVTGIATGDQAMFVERALFIAVGGFADQPLMEDIELSRRLKRAGGRPLAVAGPVRTSGRRWDANGAWGTVVSMWRLRFAYWRGVAPADLARRYARLRRGHLFQPPVTLQVFAKAPTPGAVKTRLAKAIGADRAAAIHRGLVERTLRSACAARDARVVDAVELWCAPDASDPAFDDWRARFGIALKLQPGGDLGTRMHAALRSALARGERAILIGTDCPVLDVEYLRAAASALEDNDAVFGPAEDGGYVLVGLARDADVFGGIAWGTDSVMSATQAALDRAQIRWRALPVLWDVDRPQDVARYNAMPSMQSANTRIRT